MAKLHNHTERICLAEHKNIAAAKNDGYDLQGDEGSECEKKFRSGGAVCGSTAAEFRPQKHGSARHLLRRSRYLQRRQHERPDDHNESVARCWRRKTDSNFLVLQASVIGRDQAI